MKNGIPNVPEGQEKFRPASLKIHSKLDKSRSIDPVGKNLLM